MGGAVGWSWCHAQILEATSRADLGCLASNGQGVSQGREGPRGAGGKGMGEWLGLWGTQGVTCSVCVCVWSHCGMPQA